MLDSRLPRRSLITHHPSLIAQCSMLIARCSSLSLTGPKQAQTLPHHVRIEDRVLNQLGELLQRKLLLRQNLSPPISHARHDGERKAGGRPV
jgi:hypothetical protein